MIHTKLFEIRDKATFIPAIGMRLCSTHARNNAQENYLLRRAGYGDEPLVLLAKLDGGDAYYDVYNWDNRTMQVAHDYITTHWDELESGAVIDVEFILGETTRPKASEAIA